MNWPYLFKDIGKHGETFLEVGLLFTVIEVACDPLPSVMTPVAHPALPVNSNIIHGSSKHYGCKTNMFSYQVGK